MGKLLVGHTNSKLLAMQLVALVTCFLLMAPHAMAQVRLDVTYGELPSFVKLSWNSQGASSKVEVLRRKVGEPWGSILTTVSDPTRAYTDTQVDSGVIYEYQVRKVGDALARAYVWAGLRIAPVENRGTVLLVVDDTLNSALAAELNRFEQDLIGDGWRVIRTTHGRHGTGSAAALKTWIKSQYTSNPTQVKGVILFGRLPIVKSGYMGPDGHGDRPRATDLYYGDMDGNWTDSSYNITGVNVPGDGIFDHNTLPGPVNNTMELMVGRIDLAGMTKFPASEVELLRRYLAKDHNWRHGITTAARRGIGGNGYLLMETMSVYSLFGSSNTKWGTFADSETSPYTWAVDFGHWDGSEYPKFKYQTTFTINFGSHKLNFESNDNQMRAILALPEYGLTSAWGGRPFWFFHHMGMGETVGYSALRTEGNLSREYSPACSYWFQGSIANNLMGDPTLRAHIIKPVGNLTATQQGAEVKLQWSASPEDGVAYHVYASDKQNGEYTRVTPAALTGTSFTDTNPGSREYYMVRATKLDLVASGSYQNLSQGVFVQSPFSDDSDTQAPTSPTHLTASKASSEALALTWRASADNNGVTAYDIYRNGALVGSVSGLSFTVTGLAQNTSYAFTVRAKDSAGNVSQASSTVNAMIDTASPSSPSNLVATNVVQNGLTLGWTASTDNSGWVEEYRIFADGALVFTSKRPSPASALPTKVRLSPVPMKSNLALDVVAVDRDGNTSNAARVTVSTAPSSPDRIVLNPVADVGNDTGSDQSYWANSASSIYYRFDLKGVLGRIDDATFRVFKEAATTNEIHVYAVDNDTWAENGTKPAGGALIIKKSGAGGYNDVPLGTYIIAEYAKDQLASFRKTNDAGGALWFKSRENPDTPPELVLTGSFVPDTVPPSVPTNVTASGITNTSFALSWSASSDNVKVAGYQIFVNGASGPFVTGTTTTLTNLSEGTSYRVVVKARDIAGNESGGSSELQVTTKSDDTQAPTKPTGLTVTDGLPRAVKIGWQPSSDNVAVTAYAVTINGVAHSTVTTPMAAITGLKPATKYVVGVRARDAAGNESQEATIDVTTPQESPPRAPANLRVVP